MTATVRFTEEMLGHVTFGESDFGRGAEPTRDGAGALMFHLTIEVPDIERFGTDPLREAGAVGYLRCDALGGQLPVERGVFNLFVDTEPGVKRMLYRLWFRDGVGHPLGGNIADIEALARYQPVVLDASLELTPLAQCCHSR